jgi:hypothetical protein
MSDYTTLFRSIQDEAFELFKKKNADYGNSFEEYGTIGILIRMSDKIKRAQTITNNNVTLIDTESLRDTLIDLHNYTALAITLIDKKEK